MANRGIDIQQAKARGEWAELRFMARTAEHGLYVTKPWGDSAPYDFAVDHNGHFVRVQVKCTLYKRGNSYKCAISANGVPYSPTRVDFIAAYVIPADAWYILPLAATNGQPDIRLTPSRKNSKYSPYHEAWHLLLSGAAKAEV